MKYHKINSIFKRDSKGNFIFEFSRPEFEYLKNSLWFGYEKLHGMNIRIYKTGEIHGRTDNAQIPSCLYPVLEKVREKLVKSSLPDSTILYGEGYGKNINGGNQYISNGNNFCLFDVMITGNFQDQSNVENIARGLELDFAPCFGSHPLLDWVHLIRNKEFFHSKLHPGSINEGVVLKPQVDLFCRDGERVVTKLKFRDF